MEKFIILTTQRSGSTWLMNLIDNHKHAFCAGELFKRDKKIKHSEFSYLSYKKKSWKNRINSKIIPKQNLFNYLDFFYGENQFKAVGFKLMLNQLDRYPIIEEYINWNKLKVIILNRDNILHQSISEIYAKSVNRWDNKTTADLNSPIVINQNRLISELNIRKVNHHRLLNFKAENRHLIIYEQLKNDTGKEMQGVTNFLSLSSDIKTQINTIKVIDEKSYNSLILNYDEIKTALRESEYADLVNSI